MEGITIPIGYVLINTIPQQKHEVYKSLVAHPVISELRPLFREYDMIAKIEIENTTELGRVVSNKIRSLDGVIDTKVLQ